jgi:hypothetical protein
VPVDPRWDTDGATGDFVFLPMDGVIWWRLPLCLEVVPGKKLAILVFVEVFDRDVSDAPGVAPGAKTSEHHTIAVWPTSTDAPRWASARGDQVAARMLESYRSVGIDPEIGQRDP